MNYSDDLVLQLDGLGIDMSKNPESTYKQIKGLFENTRENTFGYIEKLERFNKEFEPVYGINFFILVRDVYNKFMYEYSLYKEEERLIKIYSNYEDLTISDLKT